MHSEWHKAAIDGEAELAERLLSEGHAIDSKDRYGQTALMLASARGHEPLVDLLLAHHAALDVTAKYSLSALMLAIVNRHPEIAAKLIDAGADTTVRGTGAPGFSGKAAVDLAREAGFSEIAETLCKK